MQMKSFLFLPVYLFFLTFVTCIKYDKIIPEKVVASGWDHSYQAGYKDNKGKFAGGSEIMHLVAHKGKLYAGVGYWMDSRNSAFGGSDSSTGWAQILRLDEPTARWEIDLEMSLHLRAEILKSIVFTTDGTGQKLKSPVNLLLVGTFESGGSKGISLFTRNDATGNWKKSKIISGSNEKKGEACSVRAMMVYHDPITGIDRLFISIGELGIFSGVYDTTVPGSIRWNNRSESGHVGTRILSIIESNGSLLFTTGAQIFRRINGFSPSYVLVHDMHDLLHGNVASEIGGIRGLTVIPNPKGPEESLIFL